MVNKNMGHCSKIIFNPIFGGLTRYKIESQQRMREITFKMLVRVRTLFLLAVSSVNFIKQEIR